MAWLVVKRVCRISQNYLPETLLCDIISSHQGDWLKGCVLTGPTSVSQPHLCHLLENSPGWTAQRGLPGIKGS